SKKYHPDATGSKDATKFLMINAAYERLINWSKSPEASSRTDVQDTEFETESELEVRIQAVNRAFDLLFQSYEEYHNKIFEEMDNGIVNHLNSYNSNGDLKKRFTSDFELLIKNGMSNIISWFDKNIMGITSAYDSWINGFLKDAYAVLKKSELEKWYKSVFFRKYVVFCFLFSLISIPFGIYLDFNLLLLLFPFYVGIPVGTINYFLAVRNKFSVEERVLKLDHNKFRLSAGTFVMQFGTESSKSETSGVGAAGGAAIGMMVGGPIGAVLGGALGAILGSFFGESLYDLRKKAYEQAQARLIEINNLVLSGIEQEIPKIYNELIQAIRDNYTKNKKDAVRLLLTYSGNESDTGQTVGIPKEEHPLYKIDYGILIYTIVLILISILLWVKLHA
ncbi:MAG TPA: hypothetical protein PKO16_09760, partial [Bacteroidia bacterium]|nr:hypothetical protein [Bacteroidia bacterium]